MFNSTPAIWSAIAATFAAICSFLIMRTQHRNRVDLARPELVLTGWGRSSRGTGEGAHEVISFQSIRNAGRGVALHIVVNSFKERDKFPTAILSTIHIPILAIDEDQTVDGEILLWWKNVAGGGGYKHLPINVEISCWDSVGMRHQTRYQLLAVEQSSANVGVSDPIAPGLMLVTRTTITKPVWQLKLISKLRKLRPPKTKPAQSPESERSTNAIRDEEAA